MSAGVSYLVDELRSRAKSLPGADLAWLNARRESALATFAESGFPGPRDEDWKYLNLRQLERAALPLAEVNGEVTMTAQTLSQLGYDASAAIVAAQANGQPARLLGMPSPSAEVAGVTVMTLANALATQCWSGLVKTHLGTVADATTDGFAALNGASLTDGYFIHVAADVKAELPILLVSVWDDGGESAVSPRHLIVLENGANAQLVEHCYSECGTAYLHNTVAEIVLAQGARLEHTKLQEEGPKAFHVATIEAHVAADAHYVSHAVSVGGALSRHDVNVHLLGGQANCTLNGLYLGSARQQVDFHTRIHHRVPDCQSEQLYKGILSGSSRGVFNGQVHVHEDAQRSDAQQESHNLLLSRNAEIDTKPQLEILADDVKCTHGTTVGQLDETMLFYLRSRGVPEVQARGLLTFGFAHDLVERITVPSVADRVEHILVEVLPHGEEVKALVDA